MNMISYLQDGRLTLALTGEIDHHGAKELIRTIESKIEAYLPRECVLDFTDVTFMDSSGIAVVINALRIINRLEGKLFMSGISEQPLRVFQTAGIDKLVRIKEMM